MDYDRKLKILFEEISRDLENNLCAHCVDLFLATLGNFEGLASEDYDNSDDHRCN